MRAPPLAPVVGVGLVVVAFALASHNSDPCDASAQNRQLGITGWLLLAGVFVLVSFAISRIKARQVERPTARRAAIAVTALGGLAALLVLGNVAATVQSFCIP